MDDTTILCSKENETRGMLVRLDALINWSRMSFKPKESRSLSERCKIIFEQPLIVYKISTFTVESIEAKIYRFTRKWLGVSPRVTDVAMYCRKAKLRLPLKSIVEEYKFGKARLMVMLEDSDEPAVRSIQPQLKGGRKWKVDKAVNQGE
ncbi:reverse transcriptase [Plakobranchus ocellatus]|uniref:Reverse transcriptase n=1 Tax=Plakobranchus ocellatus TaxID=259542 RepID=A0AAV3YK10_9GAST|nr:reverse transcriptase [Plakobranchus ocellatus]